MSHEIHFHTSDFELKKLELRWQEYEAFYKTKVKNHQVPVSTLMHPIARLSTEFHNISECFTGLHSTEQLITMPHLRYRELELVLRELLAYHR
jgi:hypothetical protein